MKRGSLRRFAFRLALKLGVWDVDGMLRSMSIRQLREWVAFAELEPFDPALDNWRTGQIVATLMNIHRGKRRRPYKLADIVLKFGDEEVAKPQQTWQQQKAIAKFYAGMFNAANASQQGKRKRRK